MIDSPRAHTHTSDKVKSVMGVILPSLLSLLWRRLALLAIPLLCSGCGAIGTAVGAFLVLR